MKSDPPEPLSCGQSSLWAISPSIDFLNHGSFGARPYEILNLVENRRRHMEEDIVQRLAYERDLLEGLNRARISAARFLKANPNQLHFVENASGGIASVLRSRKWSENDEIVLTSHAYGAIKKQVEFLQRKEGVKIRFANIPWPVENSDDIAASILNSIDASTTMLILDAITSISGIVLPIKKIVDSLRGTGVEVLIDGAHVPGQLDIDLQSLSPDYFVGNFHKWTCAPIGTAFLYVSDEVLEEIAPAVPSWGQGDGFIEAFSWQGTRDYAPWLILPEVLNWSNDCWEDRRLYNNSLAKYAHDHLLEVLGIDPFVPIDGSCSAHMYPIALPESLIQNIKNPEELTVQLHEYASIEIPVMEIENNWYLRFSCQVYNSPSQYHRLGRILKSVSEGQSIIEAGMG